MTYITCQGHQLNISYLNLHKNSNTWGLAENLLRQYGLKTTDDNINCVVNQLLNYITSIEKCGQYNGSGPSNSFCIAAPQTNCIGSFSNV